MDLQEELKALKERIAEVEEQIEREQAFPKCKDFYWGVNAKGKIFCDTWGDFKFEKDMLAIGNVYQTENEAVLAVEKLKVEAILRSYSRPFDEFVNNYFIGFCTDDYTLGIDADVDFQPQGTFYFDSEEIALQAIDDAGSENIKKYIFGVED